MGEVECRAPSWYFEPRFMRVSGWTILGVMVACNVGCSTTPEESEGRKTGKLVELSDNVVLEAADDPFVSERPADWSCPETKAWYDPASRYFEVDTRYCDYVSAQFTTLLPVKAGDKIYIEGYRGKNSSPTPAEAHIAITLNGETLFDRNYVIPCFNDSIALCPPPDDPCEQPYDPSPPCDSGLQPVATAPADAPAGSPVIFHVHNHGENWYALIQMILTELAP